MSRRSQGPAKAPSQRQLRVGELIRHELSAMLSRGEIHDDVLSSHVVSVTEVKLTPDLKLATAYVMPLGGKDEREVLTAFERHRRYLRGEMARRLNLRFSPDIRFRRDETFDEADRIARLLADDRVRRDLAPKGASPDADDEP